MSHRVGCLFKACLAFIAANGFAIDRQICTYCETAQIRAGKGIDTNVRFGVWILCLLLFITMQVTPTIRNRKLQTKRLRICGDGCELLRLFLLSAAACVLYSLLGFFGVLGIGSLLQEPVLWLINTIVSVLVEAVTFWNGMIRIYMTSEQLGIKWRVIGGLCGMIPVVHLFVLHVLIRTAEREVALENQKIVTDKEREAEKICATRYPLLMVHGVFFRDFRYFNYWGRVPKALTHNGAVIYYGNHHSAASVVDCGKELAQRIRQITQESGCEKVNIIAHSKGGLDCRYAIAKCGIADRVASLTTVNTPHRGCEFADYLLTKIPQKQKDIAAEMYNAALRKLGEENPDFLSAVYDLTAHACMVRNDQVRDVPGVYYQSIGSKMAKAVNGRFPLNFSYHMVKHFDGCNDGLVGEASFPWGEEYQMLSCRGKRGISHGDMIDLNRENIEGFDVREFYVQLVHGLKERGL